MIQKFGIHLKVKDIIKSLTFYMAFGLKPVFAYGHDEFRAKVGEGVTSVREKYCGVVFDIDGTSFEIADGHVAVKADVFQETINSSKISAMFHVDSLEEIIKICEQNFFPIAVQPREFHWGTKEMVVKDPEGFVLVFIENLKK